VITISPKLHDPLSCGFHILLNIVRPFELAALIAVCTNSTEAYF
jgi:hypothetical protein